jgi:TonB family protein
MSDTPMNAENPVHISERRLHVRQRALTYLDLGAENGGLILNISEGGLLAQAADILAGDSIVRMSFEVPPFKSLVEVNGNVAWLGESKKEVGLQFIDLPEGARLQIREWVSLEATSDEFRSGEGTVGEGREQPGSSTTYRPTSSIPDSATTDAIVERQKQDSTRLLGTATPLHMLSEEGLLAVSKITASHAQQSQARALLFSPVVHISEAANDLAFEKDSPLPTGRAANPRSEEASAAGFMSGVRVPDAANDALFTQGSTVVAGAITPTRSDEALPRVSAPSVHICDAANGSAFKHDSAPTANRATPVRSVETPVAGLWSTPQAPDATPFRSHAIHRHSSSSNRMQVRRVWAVAALSAFLAVVYLSGRKSSPLRLTATPSPSTPAKVSRVATAPRGARQRHAFSRLRAQAPEARPNVLIWILSPPVNSKRDLRAGGPEKEGPPLLSLPDDPHSDSWSVPGVGSRDPIPALPEPKPLTPQQVDRLVPSHLLYRVEPMYPNEAKRQRIEGTVKLHAIIGQDGRIRDVVSVSGPQLLFPAAMNAARDWRYMPALLNGQPIESEEDISIEFRLPN